MISKFLYNTQAQDIRRWLSEIDTSTADLTGIERQIFTALVRGQSHRAWAAEPIAPLAEPTDLQELVGDHLNGAQSEIRYQAQRTDNLYAWLNETNNALVAQLEGVEKLATEASNNIQDIVQVVSQDPQFYYWVSDTFNNSSVVDSRATTALIDTDHGMVLLNPISVELVQDLTIDVLPEETRGIPGSNLLIVDKGSAGGPEREPEPAFERANSGEFSHVVDNDPSTWFEVERNFIAPRQKLSRFGRSFVHNPAGEEMDVRAVTGDLDWRAYVQWWNKSQPDTGADGKGVLLAEFKDVEDPTLVRNQLTVRQFGAADTQEDDNRARLGLRLTVGQPRPLSYINIVPFQREGQLLTVDSLKVYAQGQEIELGRKIAASPTLTNVSLLNREVLRRTGAQTAGGMFAIPSNRDIDRIELRLSSGPVKTPYGLGHPFAEKLEHVRREQRVVFFSIVSHEDVWTRIPRDETPRQVRATFSRGSLLGSLPATLAQILGLGQNLFGQVQGAAQTANTAGQGIGGILTALNQAGAAAQWAAGTQVLGTLGSQVLGAVGGALPVVGGLLAAGTLVQNLFGYNKEVSVLETRQAVDIFDGWRASVGLRGLSVMRTKFSALSQVQSVRLSFQGPVKKIGLFAEDFVPDNWGTGDWISYFLSVDGENWTQVAKITDVTLDGGLVLDQPTEDVYFRAVLRGNPLDPWTSPQLKHFALQGEPSKS